MSRGAEYVLCFCTNYSGIIIISSIIVFFLSELQSRDTASPRCGRCSFHPDCNFDSLLGLIDFCLKSQECGCVQRGKRIVSTHLLVRSKSLIIAIHVWIIVGGDTCTKIEYDTKMW